MSNYLPTIAWSSICQNPISYYDTGVFQLNKYQFTAAPLNVNEPGAGELLCEVDDYFIDFLGWPWLVTSVTEGSGIITIIVKDVNERSVSESIQSAPYPNKIGYIYRPIKDAIILAQAQLLKLDSQARDRINNIEKGVVLENNNIGFKPIRLYDFNSNNIGDWTLSGATLGTPSNSITRYTSTSNDPHIYRDFNINGGQNQSIKIRYKLIAGTDLRGQIFYSTAGHGFSASYYKKFDISDNSDWGFLELDMSDLFAGGTDWIDSEIISIRFDLGESNDVVIDLDWIGVGKIGWGIQHFEDDVYFDDNIKIQNKNANDYLNFITRNIDGADAVMNLDSLGLVTVGNGGHSGHLLMPATNLSNQLKLTADSSGHGCSIINTWGNNSNAGFLTGTTRSDGIAFQVGSSISLSGGLPNSNGTTRFAVNGDGTIRFNAGPAYSFPASDGTNDYVLTTNGAGTLSWSQKTGGVSGTITSINGSSEAAQTIVGGLGISVVDSGTGNYIHTINADLSAINYWTKSGSDLSYNSGKVLIKSNLTNLPISSDFHINGVQASNPIILITNSNYDSNDSVGTSSLILGFRNHAGVKVEARKINTNTSALDLYSESGYNVSSLNASFSKNDMYLYTNDIERFHLDVNGISYFTKSVNGITEAIADDSTKFATTEWVKLQGYGSGGTNNYVSSTSFNTGNGILTLNRSGLSSLTQNLDGRYSTSDTNYYLNGITKSSNTLTFAVSGTTNQQYTFGSNAFNSTTIPTNNNQLTNGANYVTSSGITSSGNGLTNLPSIVSMGTPSSTTGSSTNATTSSSHTHLLDADPNDIIDGFTGIAITGTYNWNISSGSNKRDSSLNSGAITINVLTADSGMSGMMRLNTGGSATTLTLQYNGSISDVYIDSGANLTLATNSVYFLTFVQSGGNYIFNLAKYKTQ